MGHWIYQTVDPCLFIQQPLVITLANYMCIYSLHIIWYFRVKEFFVLIGVTIIIVTSMHPRDSKSLLKSCRYGLWLLHSAYKSGDHTHKKPEVVIHYFFSQKSRCSVFFPMWLAVRYFLREGKNQEVRDGPTVWTLHVWTYWVPCGPPVVLLPLSCCLPRTSCDSASLGPPVAVTPSDLLWQSKLFTPGTAR